MRSSKVRYRLSPNEEAGILQQERDRRRKLRIQQVREQERAFAKQIRGQVEMKKHQELNILAIQLRDDWQTAKEEEHGALKDLYQKTLDAVGGAHLSAEAQPPYDKIREEAKVENDKKAKERGLRAIQKQQEDDEKRLQEEFALVMARKTALEIERARAALIAKKPSRQSDLNDAETIKQPTRVLHQDGFSTTHYTIPTEYAEKADPEEQGDAKQAAREEEKRMKEEMRENKQELEERKTKASLRQRHAQEKEQLEKDLNHLLEELGQMEQADRRRRQLVVSNIPKQIFVPPHKRLENKEENQKDLEQAFENMYMAKTDYAGDIELALEPALPPVEADLDLSSDISEEQFKVPERTEPKRFPQGLDEVKKKSPMAKRDTLRKLLLKVQSQKHDHKLRKKTEVSKQVVDGLPQESASPSEVTESVSSSGVTPSSVTTESTTTKTSSSSQTSSQLSQHPLSSSEMESRLTSSDSGSLETGPISDESSSNGKSTLMHPLEAAYRLRKKEKEEKNVTMRDHERAIEDKTYEEFHPLQEQTTFLRKDHNVNYQEDQKYGSESGETESLEEIPECLVKSKNEIVGQSRTVGVTAPASKEYQNFKEDNIHSSGMAEFQPLEPSQVKSLSPEPQQNLAMGTSGVERLHQGHMVNIPIEREGITFDGGSGEQMERPDEDIPRRRSGNFNRESYQQIDLRGRSKMAESQTQQKLGTATWDKGHVRVHSSTKGRVVKGGGSRNLGEHHSSQLIRDLSPSKLESVRRAYPNIYEAVTGKNSNDAESDVDSYVPSMENTSYHMDAISRMTGGDPRVESEKLDSNRKLPSKEMAYFGERDGEGSNLTRPEIGGLEGKIRNSVLEVGTGDVNECNFTEGGTSEKSSDELKDPSEAFKTSLHDYQEQLLKLQRTNELQLLEAQAQLQQRRQRLMNLYPQIQLPAYKPYIPAGYREVPGREEERGETVKEDGEENERRSVRMDLSVKDTTGRNMGQGNMLEEQECCTMAFHHTAEQGRELRTGFSGNNFEETLQNAPNFREMNSGSQGSHIDTAQSWIAGSAFEKSSGSIYMGGNTQPLQDVLRGSKISDQGPVHLQSFVTPPLHSEGSPSTSDYDSANFQFQPPQLGASRYHEAQSGQSESQRYHQESWGTPHAHGEELGRAVESKTVRQTQGEVDVSEARKMPSRQNGEHNRYESSPEVESIPNRSPHGVWRPVKELRVSVPSVDMLEQSPLTAENTSSLFSEQDSSFTRTPTAEFHSPSVGPPSLHCDSKQGEGQPVLLTPRKLAQLGGASSFSVTSSSYHGEPKVNQMSLSREAVSPRKLITPSMLVGEREETRKMQDTYLHKETKLDTSYEEDGAALHVLENMDVMGTSPSDVEIPHYRMENKVTRYQEIPTDDFGRRLESQRFFQRLESFKRDLGSQGINPTSKSSPELISPENDPRGTLQSQMTSTLSWRSLSESSLDVGKFSKFEKVSRSHSQGRLFSQDESVMLNRQQETGTHGSSSLGQVPSRADQIPTSYDQIPTSYDQIPASYDSMSTGFGQVSANKFTNDDEDMKASSKVTVTQPQDISGPSNIIEHGDETTKGNSDTNLEEPTDRGLLEALKNLMLAKARSKVPGVTTKTTNYFSHLDLTASPGSGKTNPTELYGDENEDMKSSDTPSRMVFGTGRETEDTEENRTEGSMEEVKVPMGRHRIHHKPPVANQSKLLALEEMAPHELSTIIEVETPVFESLPTFPFGEEEVEKEVQRFQNGTHQLFDENVTSSSDWGTPHHHTPGSSQGSGSNQSQEIYIHQPMMVSSVEEEVTLMGEKIGSDDLMSKELSKNKDLSITSQNLMRESLMTSSFHSASSQIGAAEKVSSKDSTSFMSAEMSSQQEILDDATISEGPINTSSENSFHQQITQQDGGVIESLPQGLTSNQLFPMTSEVLKMRSPRQENDQKLVTFEGKAEFHSLRGMTRSPFSHGTMGTSVDGSDNRELNIEEGSSSQSFKGVTVEPENGDLTLEEGPLQETLTEDGDFSTLHQIDEVKVPHPDSRMSFQMPFHQHQQPTELDVASSGGLHAPDKALGTGQFEERRLQSTEGSRQGFFEDLMGHYNSGQAEKRCEDWSQGPSSYSEGTTLEQATSEAGIMEEPELTFHTTFDTNVTLESVQELRQDEMFSNPSDSLLSFIRHEEQFAHSTPMKGPNNPFHEVQRSPSHNQATKEQSAPLTLQDALARHKASFIKASKARQKEVKVHAGTKSQAGTAFALTIKNWQKAKLEAQQKNKSKGMKKQTVSNKENVEMRPKVVPKVKTSQDRKAALKADKERTKRLYNQLEEVRQRNMQSERQKSYAENRQKRKEYEEKLKQRRLQLKNQVQKT